MGRSARLLGADERVVLRVRTHAKALFLPAAALVLVGGLLGAGAALIPSAYRPVGEYVVVLAAAALAIWWSVIPFLRWWTRTYTITNHRLIAREGILNKVGRVLPLMRINDVSYERSLMDRILGCGTLFIQTAAEGAVVLDDVPDVEHVHLVLTGLLFEPAPLPGADDEDWPPMDRHGFEQWESGQWESGRQEPGQQDSGPWHSGRGRQPYEKQSGPGWGDPYGPPR